MSCGAACYAWAVSVIPRFFDDGAGSFWQPLVNPAGPSLVFQSGTPSSPQQKVQFAYLQDSIVQTNYWLFTVAPGGSPVLTPVTPQGTNQQSFDTSFPANANDGSGNVWQVQVQNGAVKPVFNGNPVIAGPHQDPVLGQLFNFDLTGQVGFLTEYTQPGGPGTATLPADANGAPSVITGVPFEVGNAQFIVPYCGHSVNSPDIVFAAVGGVPSAVVRCPRCGIVAQIITPASLLYTQAFEFVII